MKERKIGSPLGYEQTFCPKRFAFIETLLYLLIKKFGNEVSSNVGSGMTKVDMTTIDKFLRDLEVLEEQYAKAADQVRITGLQANSITDVVYVRPYFSRAPTMPIIIRKHRFPLFDNRRAL